MIGRAAACHTRGKPTIVLEPLDNVQSYTSAQRESLLCHRSRGGDPPESAADAPTAIAERFACPRGPSHWDRAQCADQAGCSNVVSVGYWDDLTDFDVWFTPARET